MTANLLSRLQGLSGKPGDLVDLSTLHDMAKASGLITDWETELLFDAVLRGGVEALGSAVALCERVLPGKWPDILREALRLMGQEYDWHISIDRQPPELLCKFVLIAILTALEIRENG